MEKEKENSMNAEEIAEKYVHGKHENLTDEDEKREMIAEIEHYPGQHAPDGIDNRPPPLSWSEVNPFENPHSCLLTG